MDLERFTNETWIILLSKINALALALSLNLVSETETYRQTESVHLPLHRLVVLRRNRRNLVD